jgi:O-antigen/teichoic acid export membrane protein
MTLADLRPPAPARDRTERAGLAGVARGGLANLAGAAVAGLAGFGVTWLVARALGPAQAGGFFAATAAFVLVSTLAKLGTQTSLVYFPARLRATGASAQALRRCLRVGLTPVTVAAVLAGIGLWLGAPALARFTAGGFSTGTESSGYVQQLRVLAGFLPWAVLSDTLLASSRGWRAMRPTVLLDKLIRPALQLVALGALTLVAVTAPSWYTLAWAAPYLPTALLAAYVVYRLLFPRGEDTSSLSDPPPPQTARTLWEEGVPPGADARTFWRFTGPRAVASVAQLALQRVDVLLLASLAGLKAAAVYAVAGRFLVLGQFANQAISQAVQPRLAELLGRDDRHAAGALYQTATGWLVLAAWPLYLGTAIFAPVYLGLFGAGYRHATGVVVVLAGAMLVSTGCGMVDMMLSMAGRTSWNLANVVTALGVNLGADLLLIPRLGALGAALGLAAALITNNLVPLCQVAFAIRLHPFGAGTLAAAGLALGCFGLIPLAVLAVTGPTVTGALVAAALGSAGYLAGIAKLRRVLRLDAFTALRRRPAVEHGASEHGAPEHRAPEHRASV